MQQAGLALAALAACVALCPSDAILPIASSCCTEVSQHISRRLLQRVSVCHIQRADGDCDLAAVILHIKRRRICVSPHSRTVKQWMKEQAGKRNARGPVCHRRKRHSKRSGKGARRGGHRARGHGAPSQRRPR
ncbi:C-C motif chemokine ligand 28 [Phyllostomus discolor]|uniref:C-C motif chemokine n=1 Tax=Phyllostomus discolor TaxID=89673 RepID=A0A7E6DA25_9CHIR|nr:C-C motif chemokine 28 [Phyllostomus discolor]KAF6123482.1 C-C motif chemokine ligand 28 [Phyllostomus discolor]